MFQGQVAQRNPEPFPESKNFAEDKTELENKLKKRVKKKKLKPNEEGNEGDANQNTRENTDGVKKRSSSNNILVETPPALKLSYKRRGSPDDEENKGKVSLDVFYAAKSIGTSAGNPLTAEPEKPKKYQKSVPPATNYSNQATEMLRNTETFYPSAKIPMANQQQSGNPPNSIPSKVVQVKPPTTAPPLSNFASNLAPPPNTVAQTQKSLNQTLPATGISGLESTVEEENFFIPSTDYGKGADRLFAGPSKTTVGRSKRIEKPVEKPFSKLNDEEKMHIPFSYLKKLKDKNLLNVFKVAIKFYETQQKASNDRVALLNRDTSNESSVNPSVLLYAYEQQGLHGNYKKKFRVRKGFFDLDKKVLDEMWRGLKGMKKKDAMLSYIQLIQEAYDLVPEEKDLATEETTQAPLLSGLPYNTVAPTPQEPVITNQTNNPMIFSSQKSSIAAEPLGFTSSFRKSTNYHRPPRGQSANLAVNYRNSQSLMKILSVNIPDTVSDSGISNNGEDELTSNIKKYRNTISKQEFDRFSVMKMKKLDEENKEVKERLKSLNITRKPDELVKLEKTGQGLTERDIQSIRIVKEEFSRMEQQENDSDSDWSVSDDDAGKERKDKKKFITAQLGEREGPHQEIPRDQVFRNSLAPYNDVRTIIDSVAKEAKSMMIDDPGFTVDDGFSGLKEPSIVLEDYLFRLARYLDSWFYEAPGSKSVGCRSIVVALLFFYRIRKMVEQFLITRYNIHRLFAVMTLIAAKFYEDYIVSHSYWSEVSGIPTEELNSIEDLLCALMQFNFYVTEGELKKFYRKRKFVEN